MMEPGSMLYKKENKIKENKSVLLKMKIKSKNENKKHSYQLI